MMVPGCGQIIMATVGISKEKNSLATVPLNHIPYLAKKFIPYIDIRTMIMSISKLVTSHPYLIMPLSAQLENLAI